MNLDNIDHILDRLSDLYYRAIAKNDGIARRTAALEIHSVVRDEWLAAYRDMRQIEMEERG